MTTKITREEILDRTSFLGHAVLAAVADTTKDVSHPVYQAVKDAGDDGIEITFEIAGVRLDARAFFLRFKGAMTERVRQAAYDLAMERIGVDMDRLAELREDFETKVRETFGIPEEE